MPTYKEVPASTVPAANRHAAQEALDVACRLLRLALPPTIVWIRESTEATRGTGVETVSYPLPIDGLTKGRAWAMWVRGDLPSFLTARVVAHETAHLYHRTRNRPDALSRADEEADCDGFAERVMQALGLC